MGRKSQHRSALLRAAQELLRQRGFRAMAVADVLALSGAPRGSLYHHFPEGKMALAAAAVEASAAAVRRHLLRLAARHPTPKAFFQAYGAALGDWMAGSNFRDGCPLATVMLETASEAPALQAAGQAAFHSWLAVFAELFRNAGDAPAVATARAEHCLAVVEGALLLARVQQSPDLLRTLVAACGNNHWPSRAAEDSAHE
jgi:TetR/AcrR family transcriptional repressor of lmrAB and yxaGH operons